MKKKIAFTCAAVLAGVTFLPSAARAEAPGRATVTLSGQSSIEGDEISITGQTNLPDGAWLIFAVYSVAHPQTRWTDYMRIRDGHFSAQVGIRDWPSGNIETDIHFETMLPDCEQPAIVLLKYGAKGERMKGDVVVQEGESYRAAVISLHSIKP